MSFSFSNDDFDRIAEVLGVKAKKEEGVVRFELQNESNGRKLALEIHPNLALSDSITEDETTNLVSVYSQSSFLQLQRCTGFIASEELGEVIFFARNAGATNGLVVEREVGCSLYANVDDRLLSTDFTQLPPELIMSSVVLSMTETLFNDLG